MAYVPHRGDIAHLDFDPASGQETKGPHVGLVLSSEIFNRQGLAVICPVLQGAAASARTYGTVVSLMGTATGTGTETHGAVHCHQLKALDWRARKVCLKERAPQYVMDDVLARVDAIMFG